MFKIDPLFSNPLRYLMIRGVVTPRVTACFIVWGEGWGIIVIYIVVLILPVCIMGISVGVFEGGVPVLNSTLFVTQGCSFSQN